MNNVYNTNDPAILLQLKRMEADALRDVIRALNDQSLKIEHAFKIAQNTLLAQLGVKKMRFLYESNEGIKTGFQVALPSVNEQEWKELPRTLAVMQVKQEEHPHLFKCGVEYVIPANFHKKVAAWFLIAEFADSEAEKENDLIFIETLANVLSAAIENRNLTEDLVRQESLRRELEVAERIQKQLLLQDFSDVVVADVYARNIAHFKIGGDFYDIIPRGNQGFFVCIADVSGKGMGAALLMATIQAHLRALILSQNSLTELVKRLHDIIIKTTQGEKFVTLFIAHIRAIDHEMDYVNAGHHPPLMVKQGQGLLALDKGTLPLGILPILNVEEATVTYDSGDLLFLYTDGLVDQTNEKDDMFGEERLKKILVAESDKNPVELIQKFESEHSRFAGAAEHDHDITMVAVRFH